MQKYKCIVFTDKDGNILDNTNDVTDDDTSPITPEITGEHDSNTLEITGVDDNNKNTDTNTTQGNEHIQQYDMETNNTNKQYDGNLNEQYNKDYNDDISVENESPDDIHVTINEMNTVHEMNSGQLNMNPETQEEETNANTHNLRR